MIIILVRPQLGENIGAAARVMQNFGLTEMRLVAPRDGWPNPAATATATRAAYILEEATLHPTLEDAIADCHRAYATTARRRELSTPVTDMRDGVAEMRAAGAAGQKVALVFGPERTGLTNDELAIADRLVTIPTGDEHSSLNLAQAVAIAAYEWFTMQAPVLTPNAEPPAPKEELLALFEHLEGELDKGPFYKTEGIKPIMQRNIRAMLTRANLTSQEVKTLRGVVAALAAWKDRRQSEQ